MYTLSSLETKKRLMPLSSQKSFAMHSEAGPSPTTAATSKEERRQVYESVNLDDEGVLAEHCLLRRPLLWRNQNHGA